MVSPPFRPRNAENLRVNENLHQIGASPAPVRAPDVRFATADEDDERLGEARLVRHNTPHPKDLKALRQRLLDRADANEPGADEPGADEPGADHPGADHPGVDEPAADAPGAD